MQQYLSPPPSWPAPEDRQSHYISLQRPLFWGGNSEILLAVERHPSAQARNYTAAQI